MFINESNINRRKFLQSTGELTTAAFLGSAGLLSTKPGFAGVSREDEDLQKYDFIMPRVKFACQSGVAHYWHSKPGGDANLLQELKRVIRCKIKPIEGTNNRDPLHAQEGQLNGVVTFDEPERLKKYPFLFMMGESHYQLNQQQKDNLRDYIYQGGFLLMDDCMAQSVTDWFFASSLVLVQQVFGKEAVRRI